MTVIVGMNDVNIIVLTKPISYLKYEDQLMDSCIVLYCIELLYWYST